MIIGRKAFDFMASCDKMSNYDSVISENNESAG